MLTNDPYCCSIDPQWNLSAKCQMAQKDAGNENRRNWATAHRSHNAVHHLLWRLKMKVETVKQMERSDVYGLAEAFGIEIGPDVPYDSVCVRVARELSN